jgi:hypothetical protein
VRKGVETAVRSDVADVMRPPASCRQETLEGRTPNASVRGDARRPRPFTRRTSSRQSARGWAFGLGRSALPLRDSAGISPDFPRFCGRLRQPAPRAPYRILRAKLTRSCGGRSRSDRVRGTEGMIVGKATAVTPWPFQFEESLPARAGEYPIARAAERLSKQASRNPLPGR